VIANLRTELGEKAASPSIDDRLRWVLTRFPGLELALLFGSVAKGQQRRDSDLDIAVAAKQALTVAEKVALVDALTESSGRTIDLIDLKTVTEPLLGQIVRHGRRLLGSDSAYGQLISRHLFEQTDFLPYRTRVLAERRAAWIGKSSRAEAGNAAPLPAAHRSELPGGGADPGDGP
jgi:predicted nucleotidyltransferase